MVSKRKKNVSRYGLQVVTLCISTTLVLILLGIVVSSAFITHNLTSYVKENLVMTLMLDGDISTSEAKVIYKELQKRDYIRSLTYVSREQALREQIQAMGSDPTEFMGGENPFLPSIELTLKSSYANNDSLSWISRELKQNKKISEVVYQQDLVEQVNNTLGKVSLVLLILAGLLTFISFSLINNTIRLSMYSHRFTIHTMKLVGASWNFIRKPFVLKNIVIGVISSFIAIGSVGAIVIGLCRYEIGILEVLTPDVMVISALSILFFGVLITFLCSYISVNKFLKMKAGELYKI